MADNDKSPELPADLEMETIRAHNSPESSGVQSNEVIDPPPDSMVNLVSDDSEEDFEDDDVEIVEANTALQISEGAENRLAQIHHDTEVVQIRIASEDGVFLSFYLRPPEHFPYQHNQVALAPGGYHENMLPESSLRLPALPLYHQADQEQNQVPLAPRGYHENPSLDLSLSLRPPTLPRHHQTNQQHDAINLMQIQYDPTHYHNPMMQDPLAFILPRPHQLPDHQQMMLILANSQYHNSEFLGPSMSPSVSHHHFGAPNTMGFSIQNSFFLYPFVPPCPMMNSLYDPTYEGLGLPIDPHLRLLQLP